MPAESVAGVSAPHPPPSPSPPPISSCSAADENALTARNIPDYLSAGLHIRQGLTRSTKKEQHFNKETQRERMQPIRKPESSRPEQKVCKAWNSVVLHLVDLVGLFFFSHCCLCNQVFTLYLYFRALQPCMRASLHLKQETYPHRGLILSC